MPKSYVAFESLRQPIEPQATDRKSKTNVTFTRAEVLDAQTLCYLREPQITDRTSGFRIVLFLAK
jgi:hypothetical protein